MIVTAWNNGPHNTSGAGYGVKVSAGDRELEYVEDGVWLEIDSAEGVVRNRRTGKSERLAKYPESIDRVFNAGGIIPLLPMIEVKSADMVSLLIKRYE